MDRTGLAVLLLLTVALGHSHKEASGGRKEVSGPERTPRDRDHHHQQQQPPQGHIPEGFTSSVSAGDTSPGSGSRQSRTLVRLPRSASSTTDGRSTSRAGGAAAASAAGVSQPPAPRDGAQRSGRQTSSSQQHRSRGNHRQSSSPGSGRTRRLVG